MLLYFKIYNFVNNLESFINGLMLFFWLYNFLYEFWLFFSPNKNSQFFKLGVKYLLYNCCNKLSK